MQTARKPARYLPPPDPLIHASHRRQILWQVWFPLGLGAAIILAVAVLVCISAASGNPELTRWSNISLLSLILPAALSGVLLLSMLVLVIYVMIRLRPLVPPYAHLARAYGEYLSVMARYWADRIVKPVLGLHSLAAGWRAFFQHFRHG
jgi:hypothetical protein